MRILQAILLVVLGLPSTATAQSGEVIWRTVYLQALCANLSTIRDDHETSTEHLHFLINIALSNEKRLRETSINLDRENEPRFSQFVETVNGGGNLGFGLGMATTMNLVDLVYQDRSSAKPNVGKYSFSNIPPQITDAATITYQEIGCRALVGKIESAE